MFKCHSLFNEKLLLPIIQCEMMEIFFDKKNESYGIKRTWRPKTRLAISQKL